MTFSVLKQRSLKISVSTLQPESLMKDEKHVIPVFCKDDVL